MRPDKATVIAAPATVMQVTAPSATKTDDWAAPSRAVRVTMDQAMWGTSAGERLDMGGVL